MPGSPPAPSPLCPQRSPFTATRRTTSPATRRCTPAATAGRSCGTRCPAWTPACGRRCLSTSCCPTRCWPSRPSCTCPRWAGSSWRPRASPPSSTSCCRRSTTATTGLPRAARPRSRSRSNPRGPASRSASGVRSSRMRRRRRAPSRTCSRSIPGAPRPQQLPGQTLPGAAPAHPAAQRGAHLLPVHLLRHPEAE